MINAILLLAGLTFGNILIEAVGKRNWGKVATAFVYQAVALGGYLLLTHIK